MADHGKHAFHDGSRAFAPLETKALGPNGIKDEIQRLAGLGYYGIPTRVFLKSDDKKGTRFPKRWKHIKTPESWKEHIQSILDRFVDPNGIAILTGLSNLYVIDVDVDRNDEKPSGMCLWRTLVAKHGEPDTLKVISGRDGLHLYFKRDQTIGLKKLNNFERLTVKNVSYGVDGRGVGGLIFAPLTT
jgi:hypothetical protein